jgi:alkylhydroperoxidase family enzyme
VTTASTPVAPIYLADIETGGRPGPHQNMIEAAKAQGSEYWQIWHLFAFRPDMTIHLGRFTHALMHEPGPITPALRELIAAYTSRLNDCAFCMKSHAAVTAHLFFMTRHS